MSYQDKAVEEILREIKKILRLQVAKTTLSKRYYEYRISKVNIKDLKLPLYKLYHLAFEQGVYVNKR